jgi:hypothetical protein
VGIGVGVATGSIVVAAAVQAVTTSNKERAIIRREVVGIFRE